MSNAQGVEIELCLGSACFSRGNNGALSALTRYVEENGLQQQVTIKGALCRERCKEGPIVSINGTHYTRVDGPSLIDIVKRLIEGTS